ncbi:hypothetical protein TNCV_3656231 [Trichonephila clavipes]|nr:hypothetical protein TNCV_3656231 [Trichonephila clavipes]
MVEEEVSHNRSLGWNVSTVHDCWEKRPRDGTASRRPCFEQVNVTTEKEDHRIRRTAVAHHTSQSCSDTTNS